MTSTAAYQELLNTLREIAMLGSVASVLGWDERTMLPHKGTAHRAEQMSLLARMLHEKFTAARVGELLAAVEDSDLVADRHGDAAVNVRETRRSYDRATKLPASLVEELTRTASLGEAAWVEARQNSNYAAFEPWLAKTLDLKRQQAACVGFAENPYDALLDEFEPGETAAGIEAVFNALRPKLVELNAKIAASPRKAPLQALEGRYPQAKQESFARVAATLVGFDFEAGRLDTSAHPFCSGIGIGDTRITTRYDETDFTGSFFGVLHETGHAMYDQGLPDAHWGLPRGEAISLGIHESQSRMWENFVGRSRSFWKFFLPKAKMAFPHLDSVDDDTFTFAINDVRPSLIRTESDEATYNLHVMLRFDLEQALLRGDVSTKDLPMVWNTRMARDLGVTPPNDAQGCLQDIHWAGGAIGYFPTYTLGNLYAAQFFEQARADLGDLDAMFARGEFAPLLGWLRKHIHEPGKTYTARELVQKVTGKSLTSDALMRHLSKKAADYYGV